MGAVEQMDLFPIVTTLDRQMTLTLLREYRKMRLIIDELVKREVLSEHECLLYEDWLKKVGNIELAVHTITDEEVKKLIEYRYLKGYPRKAVVFRWSALITERSIDRKINEGVDMISNTLKLLGVLDKRV